MCVAKKGECQHGDMDSNCSYSSQRTFDYMLFVESWDGSFCSDGCCILPDTGASVKLGFSVHGLWPEYYDNDYPSCCSSNITRDMIDNLLERNTEVREMLNTHWPALKRCRFVRYETEKHGTCAAAVYGATENGLIDYWTAIVKLSSRFDHEKALASAGIVPSETTLYKLSEVQSAINRYVGAKVNVACQSGNIIDEVRVCVKRPTNAREMLNPVVFNCPNPEDSCDSKVYFLPVPNVPSGGGCKN